MLLTLRRMRTLPCAMLLAVQLLGVLLYPFMEGAEVGRPLPSLTRRAGRPAQPAAVVPAAAAVTAAGPSRSS